MDYNFRTIKYNILSRKPIFTTKKPDGAFRDEIVIEIQALDNQPFKGMITPKEARRTILEEILGFKQEFWIIFCLQPNCHIPTERAVQH